MGLLTDNPVLQKEVRSRFRARRQSKTTRIGSAIAIGAVVVLLYYFSISSFVGSSSVRSTGEGMFSFFSIGLELTLILFLAPSLASAAITQEREQQTWNALLLSRLSPGEIVVGKFVAALFPALVVLAIFSPLKAIAAMFGGVNLVRYLLTNTLLLLITGFYVSVSLFWSWVCKRTYMATAASFGTVAFFVVGTYILYGLFAMAQNGSYSPPEKSVLLWLNPYTAMSAVASDDKNNIAPMLAYSAVYLAATLGVLSVMTARLTRGAKELEQ